MIEKVFVRSAYNYDMAKASEESGLRCEDPSLTKQSFAEEADINTIVRRFHLTGEMPEGIVVPQYGEFEEVFDFHSAMNMVAFAKEQFDAVPAALRARFHNDPGEFVDFFNDERNRKEAEELGLIVGKAKDAKGSDGNGGKLAEVRGGLRDNVAGASSDKGKAVADDGGSGAKAGAGDA